MKTNLENCIIKKKAEVIIVVTFSIQTFTMQFRVAKARLKETKLNKGGQYKKLNIKFIGKGINIWYIKT